MSKLYEDDGWNAGELSEFLILAEEIDDVAYEVKNCVRSGFGQFGSKKIDLVRALRRFSREMAVVADDAERIDNE